MLSAESSERFVGVVGFSFSAARSSASRFSRCRISTLRLSSRISRSRSRSLVVVSTESSLSLLGPKGGDGGGRGDVDGLDKGL
jgi:hypothetical protein